MTRVAALSSELLHATCVSIDGRGVLIDGPSGSGKSDLALRLIDRGARLVADDYTLLRRRDGRLFGAPPVTIAGRIEVRGIGIVAMPHVDEVEIALHVDLEHPVERMPDPALRRLAGVAVPDAALAPFEPSAPIKVEMMLRAVPA